MLDIAFIQFAQRATAAIAEAAPSRQRRRRFARAIQQKDDAAVSRAARDLSPQMQNVVDEALRSPNKLELLKWLQRLALFGTGAASLVAASLTSYDIVHRRWLSQDPETAVIVPENPSSKKDKTDKAPTHKILKPRPGKALIHYKPHSESVDAR